MSIQDVSLIFGAPEQHNNDGQPKNFKSDQFISQQLMKPQGNIYCDVEQDIMIDVRREDIQIQMDSDSPILRPPKFTTQKIQDEEQKTETINQKFIKYKEKNVSPIRMGTKSPERSAKDKVSTETLRPDFKEQWFDVEKEPVKKQQCCNLM